LVFPGPRVVIFVDGCFWHGCGKCHDFKKDCNSWWQEKIFGNRMRDNRRRRRLRKLGWHVWRVWEHDLRQSVKFEKTIARLSKMLRALMGEDW